MIYSHFPKLSRISRSHVKYSMLMGLDNLKIQANIQLALKIGGMKSPKKAEQNGFVIISRIYHVTNGAGMLQAWQKV